MSLLRDPLARINQKENPKVQGIHGRLVEEYTLAKMKAQTPSPTLAVLL